MWHQAQIADNVHIGSGCTLGKSCYVGSDSWIGNNVTIADLAALFGAHVDDVMISPQAVLTDERVSSSGSLPNHGRWP